MNYMRSLRHAQLISEIILAKNQNLFFPQTKRSNPDLMIYEELLVEQIKLLFNL